MKTITLFTVIVVCFFAVITAMVRPDIVEHKYQEMRAPIDNYFAQKNAQIWNDAKETERATWLIKLHLPADCGAPKTAMREIECHNLMQLHIDKFEQTWSNKIRGGWKPEGV